MERVKVEMGRYNGEVDLFCRGRSMVPETRRISSTRSTNVTMGSARRILGILYCLGLASSTLTLK